MALLRVMIVSTASGYGGAERNVELLAGELAERCEITVIAQHPAHVKALRARLRQPGQLVVWPNRWGRLNRWQNVRRFCQIFLDRAPDAVVTNTEGAADVVGIAAGLLPNLSARTSVYVQDFQWQSFAALAARLPGAEVLVPSPAVVDRSDYLAPYLRPRGQLRWRVVPGPVRLPGELRDSLERPAGGSYWLHLATVNPWKGHAHLIAAAQRLVEQGWPVKIISRGAIDSEPLQRQLTAQIQTAGLTERFALGPFVPDPTELLQGCRGVLVTSVSHHQGPETFGRTVIEAWAHRRPVVAFAAGGVRYLIEHERDGLLVPEGDESALAAAIDRLEQDEALCRRLGEAGYAKVFCDYQASRVADRLLAGWER